MLPVPDSGAHAHTHAHAHAHAHTHTHTHIHMHIHTRTRTRTCTYAHPYAHAHPHAPAHMHIHMHMHMHIHMHVDSDCLFCVCCYLCTLLRAASLAWESPATERLNLRLRLRLREEERARHRVIALAYHSFQSFLLPYFPSLLPLFSLQSSEEDLYRYVCIFHMIAPVSLPVCRSGCAYSFLVLSVKAPNCIDESGRKKRWNRCHNRFCATITLSCVDILKRRSLRKASYFDNHTPKPTFWQRSGEDPEECFSQTGRLSTKSRNFVS
jgi:hypothetical protein